MRSAKTSKVRWPQLFEDPRKSSRHSVLVDLGMAYIEYALAHRDDFRLLYLRPLAPRARRVVETFPANKGGRSTCGLSQFDFEEDEMAHAMGDSWLALSRLH